MAPARIWLTVAAFGLAACGGTSATTAPSSQRGPTPIAGLGGLSVGTYTIEAGGHKITGSYTVSGDQVTFVETENGYCANPGTYKWSLQPPNLSFSVVSDSCEGGGRANDFTGGVWVKK